MDGFDFDGQPYTIEFRYFGEIGLYCPQSPTDGSLTRHSAIQSQALGPKIRQGDASKGVGQPDLDSFPSLATYGGGLADVLRRCGAVLRNRRLIDAHQGVH